MCCMPGAAVPLVVADDSPVGEEHVARVPPALVAEDGHQRRASCRVERRFDRGVVAVEIRVAVEHEERLAEHRPRTSKRASRPEQALAVERIANVQPEAPAIANRLPNLFAEMPDAEDDALDAARAKERQLMLRERPARHLDQRLGHRRGVRSQARRQAAGENRDGQHHANRTLVPSKSKRKRTSSSPALLIAARSRR